MTAAFVVGSPDALAFAALVRAEALKDKSYRATPVGLEVGRFIRALNFRSSPKNTRDTYEIVLAKLSVDFAHLQTLDEFTTDDVMGFLEEHWGDSAPATKANRLFAVKSFFRWAVEEGRAEKNPAASLRAPKVRRNQERHAYPPDAIHNLIVAQPNLRDQIALQLLGRLGLRKNELRLLRLRDFDLSSGNRGTVLVHGKGDKDVVLPLGFERLQDDLKFFLVNRNLSEYLLYPRGHPDRPMDPASVHRWFKACLDRAGLPDTVKLHELRHSAADNLWRKTGNLVLAQKLLRHESVATTQAYLHPSRDDLADALSTLDEEATT